MDGLDREVIPILAEDTKESFSLPGGKYSVNYPIVAVLG
jgi:hypothetical protein